jgi:hypothetical protein
MRAGRPADRGNWALESKIKEFWFRVPATRICNQKTYGDERNREYGEIACTVTFFVSTIVLKRTLA